MKTTAKLLAATLISTIAISCYDDTDIQKDLNNLKDEFSELREDIDVIQNILNSIDGGDMITSVKETKEGYEIVFASGKKIIIRNGQGYVPGEGEESSRISDIRISENTITFILDNGQEVVVPIVHPLDIIFDIDDDYLYPAGTELLIAYTITGGSDNNLISISSKADGYVEKISNDSGIIHLYTAYVSDFEVIVLVSDGVSRTIFKTLKFIQGTVYIDPPMMTCYMGAEGGMLNIPVHTNVDYDIEIDADWITAVKNTKAYEMRNETLTLHIDKNSESYKRTANVKIYYGWAINELTIIQDQATVEPGFAPGTWEETFNIDPYTELTPHIPHYHTPVIATLAYIDDYLILNHYDNSDASISYTPIYVDCLNGSYKGEISTGGLTNIGAITNDEGGNMLLCNYLSPGQGTLNIYSTTSVTTAPTLFHSTNINADLPIGSKIKVCGDINTDATIVIPFDGINGVTESGKILNIKTSNGTVVEESIIDLGEIYSGLQWGAAPCNNAGIVPSDSFGNNGWFYGKYDSYKGMQWIRPNMTLGNEITLDGFLDNNYWLIRPGTLDTKQFNGVTYMAHLILHHFPGWAGTPSIWIYDITDPSTVTGTFTPLKITSQASS